VCRRHRLLQESHEGPTPWSGRGAPNKRGEGRRWKQEEEQQTRATYCAHPQAKVHCNDTQGAMHQPSKGGRDSFSMAADLVSVVDEALLQPPPPPTPKLPTGQTDIDVPPGTGALSLCREMHGLHGL